MTTNGEILEATKNSILSMVKIMDKPQILTSKGTLKGVPTYNGLTEYDSALMPCPPQVLQLHEQLNSLINAYRLFNA